LVGAYRFEKYARIYYVTIDKYIHNNNKDGDLKMFRELRDLIIEGLHLLLLYGFLCVCAIGVIAVFIANAPKNTSEPPYYAATPPQPIILKEPSEKSLRVVEKESICNRIEGCATFTNAKTPEEYCPTCEWVIKR
jgi:hypothetical protein